MRLSVTDFGAARGGRRVFAGARFAYQGGAIVALEGPNGSGKSTLLRALAGLTPADQGEAAVEDAAGRASLSEDRDAFQERILYAGHLDAVKPALSVRENLAFWARFYGAPDADLDGALAQFGLSGVAENPAATCSAGQKRRLGLARLAAVDRPIWLLDEPTVSLDAASVRVFAGLIEARAAADGVVIVATHAPIGATPTARLDMMDFAVAPGAPAAAAGGRRAEDDLFLEDGPWT